jgi:hypothetical protein
MDLYPDVYIGRLPCRNAYEVDVMVEKIITYETTAYGSDWAKRLVGIGGDTFTSDIYSEGDLGVQKVHEYLEPLGVVLTMLTPDDDSLSEGQDIIDAISEGCGFLDFEGHGNPMSWATHPYQNEDVWIGIDESQFIMFKNKDMYPICMIGGCSNSKFNISLLNLLKFNNLEFYIYHSEWGPECFSWWMTRKVDGGSVATIGSFSYGYGAIGDADDNGIPDTLEYNGGFIDAEFFRVYAQEGKETIGAAHSGAITNYLIKFHPFAGSGDRIDGKTVEEWVLMGDPSLKIGGYQ